MNAKFSHRIQFEQGFSLVEIMVALTLGAIILLGVTQIFTNNSRTRAEIDRTAAQIESGAYALGLIESDLTSAGFWGEAGEQPAGGTLPPVCPGLGTDLAAAGLELQESLGYPVQGEGTLASSCAAPKAGSEFLAVRRTSSCGLNPDDSGCAPISSNFYLQVNACFEPSDSSLPLPGLLLISTDQDELEYTQRDCTTLAPRYQLFSRVYYINSDDVLVRAELDRASSTSAYLQTPLVEGVETMRFEYGIDTDGDGQVDLNTATPAGTQWADVVMVRVALVVRNLEPSPGYADTRTYTVGGEAYTVPTDFQEHKRQVYTRTVSVRNTAGRREVQ
jgi:type IV pilus assembly protein PilW